MAPEVEAELGGSSQEYHYVRTLGDDGGVEACDGQAIGLDLESVLADGLPPWNVALEVIAAVCEILDIAEEDGEVHGAVDPRFVFVDETGAVSVEGFGTLRRGGAAPEPGDPTVASDLYGLGRLAYQLLSAEPLPDARSFDDEGEHDDAIIDAVLKIDLEGIPDEWHGDVQWFLAKLMSYDPEERPPAVDAWRTFIAFAGSATGPDVVAWCNLALEGGGERRASQATDPEPADELDGPTVEEGPLAGGGLAFDGGSGGVGGSTAFWSRDAMKAALEASEREDVTSFKPAVGGGEVTGFWSKEQMDAMRTGVAEAPRPKRSQGRGANRGTGERRRNTGARQRPEDGRRPAPVTAPTRTDIAMAEPLVRPPPAGPAPTLIHDRPPPRPAPDPTPMPITPPPAPVVRQRPTPPAPPPQEDDGNQMVLAAAAVLLVALVLVLGCMGVFGGGGILYALVGQAPPEAVQPSPAEPTLGKVTEEAEKSEESEDAGSKPDDEADDDKGGGSTTGGRTPSTPTPPRRAPSTGGGTPSRGTPTRTPSSSRPRPTPKKPPEPPPPPPAGSPAKVTFSTAGRGTIRCAGQTLPFDGPTVLEVDGFQLPATCLITMDGGRGVFQVFGSGSITCNLQGGAVACNKDAVR